MTTSIPNSERSPNRGKRLVIMAMALTLAGCIEADYRPSSNSPALPPFDGPVEVLKKFPPGEHLVLGTLFVEGGLAVGESTMLKALREKAAAIGANAIVMQGKLRTSKGPDGTRTKIAAFAIRKP